MSSVRIKKFELNDPKTKNAFSLEQAEKLASELSLKKKTRDYDAILFTAVGSHFCSGGNLSFYAQQKTSAQGKAANRKIAAILDQLASLPVPTACVVHGDCFGGGVELLSAFDFVVCTPEVQFGFWQRRIGLSFGWGGRQRLARRLTEAKLDQLALRSQNISSYEALNLGLVDEIDLSSTAVSQAEKWLVETATLPALPLELQKKSIGKKLNERTLFEKLWWNKEHLKVLHKFK